MATASAAIDQLVDDLTFFIRGKQRLFHVVADPELWGSVVEIVPTLEAHPRNRSAFVTSTVDHRKDDHGWRQRTLDARALHEARQAQMREVGENLPDLEAFPVAGDPKAMFSQQLWQLVQARPPESEGLVVVLAPSVVEAAPKWAEAIGLLLTSRQLGDVRWIVIDRGASTIDPIVAALRDLTMAVTCTCDTPPAAPLLEALAAGAERVGAGPAGLTPPHPSDPPKPEPTPQQHAQRQIEQALAQALLASAGGDTPNAVGAQRRAIEVARQAKLPDQLAGLEMLLGSTLMAAGQADAAKATFGRALEAARAAGRPDQAAHACFGLGALQAAKRDRHAAVCSFADATVHAEQAKQPMLTVEGGRMAGQLAEELRLEAQAIAFYSKAVKVAEAHPDQAPLSSGAAAARSLAALCRKRSLWVEAQDLDKRADKLETPQWPQPAAVPEPPKAPAKAPAPAQVPAPEKPAVPALPPLPGPPQSTPARQAPVATPPLLPIAEVLPPAPRVAPAAVVFEAHPDDDASMASYEGTALLSVDEIARIHWQGVVPPYLAPIEPEPPVFVAPPIVDEPAWAPEQLERLRIASHAVLDEHTSTRLLRADERAVMAGEAPLQPPPLVLPTKPAPSVPNVDPAKVAALLRELEEQPEHETNFMRRDEFFARMQQRARDAKKPNGEDDQT